jgi:HEAT repeat protein
MFGPLFYTTLVVAIPLGIMAILTRIEPFLSERHELQALVEGLRSANPSVRDQSARRLEQRGSVISLPLFLEAARGSRAEVRAVACRSLAETLADPQAVIPVLVSAAHDRDDSVREEACRGLGRFAAFYASMPGKTAGARAAQASERRADCLEALRQLLRDRSSSIRAAAAESLSGFGRNPQVAADLASIAGDPDRTARFAAARALVKLDGPQNPVAIQTLLALLAEPDVVADRRAVLEFLAGVGPIPHDQAVAALAGLLSHEDIAVISDVVDCLAADGPRARAALPALNRLLELEDSRLRATTAMAILAIEGQESPRAVELLLRMIGDRALDFDVRGNAVGMLREVNPAALSKATPELICQLGSTAPQVRQHAAQLLSMIVEDTCAEMPILTQRR